MNQNIELLEPADGFLGIEEDASNAGNKAKVVVIPFGLEATVSYGVGTSKGPEAIIRASHQVELFDEELWCEPYKSIGIETFKPFPIKKKVEDAIEQIENITSHALNSDKFPLILGGEHSLTAGAIKAVVQRYGDISILHFDAHADLRDSYSGEKYSHASALRRCLDYEGVKHLVSVGIRNISAEEIPFLEVHKDKIHIFWAKDKYRWNVEEIVAKLGKNTPVYITFDLDGFDSSVMPATGTPEPGGIFWDDAMRIIHLACLKCKVVGADIVELAPVDNLHHCDFLAAKLGYKIISYAFSG